MQNLTESLRSTHQLITNATLVAKRPKGCVRLLAVSKKHPAERIREAFALGQTAFGENYVQEALEKQQLLSDLAIQWHFIGPIQSNKTRQIAEYFDWAHSVDRIKIAERLSQQRPEQFPPINLCLQVNIDNEATKSGFMAEELNENIHHIATLPNIRLRGLMAIPAPKNSYAEQLTTFEKISELFEQLKPDLPHWDTLSIGMSDDLQAAIAAGSTMVRIGTGIFGARS